MNRKNFSFEKRVLAGAFLLWSLPAFAAGPRTMSYQGNMTVDGKVFNGTKSFVFRVYDALTGGNLLWTEPAQNVDVRNGIFSASVDLSGVGVSTISQLYFEIWIDGTQMSPRDPAAANPYSINSRSITGTSNVVPDSGNVGFGTLSPAALLHVSSGSVQVGDLNASTISASGFLTLANLASAPSASKGRVYFDQSGALKVSLDGSSFVALSTGGSLPATLAYTDAANVFTSAGGLTVGYALTASSGTFIRTGDFGLVVSSGVSVGQGVYAGFFDGSGARLRGELSMNGNSIRNLASPSSASDAATKGYVDSAGGGYASLAATQTFSGQNTFGNAVTVSSTVFISGPVQSVGGRARGSRAVDLQTNREDASYAASGEYSAVGGGFNNRASGGYSVVAGGYRCLADGYYSAVVGGKDNASSGLHATVFGGKENVAGGDYSTIVGGRDNVVAGDYSFAAGARSSSTADGTFTWSGSMVDMVGNAKLVLNNVPYRTWFMTPGGFLVSGSTDVADRGFFVAGTGRVGLGTTTPSANLHVVGDVRIASGTPTAGWVLTAVDSTGLASWNAASGGDVFKASSQIFSGANTFAGAAVFSSGLTASSGTFIRTGDFGLVVSSGVSVGQGVYAGFFDGSGARLRGELSMNGNSIRNLASPSSASDAATKGYVDSAGGGYASLAATQAFSGQNTFSGALYFSSGIYSTGGDPRGENAVDLQYFRASDSNVASGRFSSIGGGASNTASGYASRAGGGMSNMATGSYATVGGGFNNGAENSYATVSGGTGHTASGQWSVVSGGGDNEATGRYSTVSGGSINFSVAEGASVGGGMSNRASGNGAVVSGGSQNEARGASAAVSGGTNNNAFSNYSAVAGGVSNNANGLAAFVAGGKDSTAGGEYSFAAGRKSSSTANGAFTWADSEGVIVINDAADRTWFKNRGGFLVTPSTGAADRGLFVSGSGKTGLGTTAPTALLHVAGDLRIASGTPTAGWVLTAVDSTGLATWGAGSGGDVFKASTQTFSGANTFVGAAVFNSGLTASSGTFQRTGDFGVLVSSGVSVGQGVYAGFFSGSGAGLTGVPASQIAAGTFASGVLLPAGNLSGGVVSPSVLPSTVAYTDAANIFTAAGGLTVSNGLTASSGTFTRTGGYGLLVSSGVSAGFFFGDGYGITDINPASHGHSGVYEPVIATLGVSKGGTGVGSTPSNGQLLIGNGAGFSLAALSGTGGVSISNGAGTASVGLDISGLSAVTSASADDALVIYSTTSLANRKITKNNLLADVLGGLNYRGTWDANANSPHLTSGVGTKGYYYVVSVAGNTSLDGTSTWNLNDWLVFNDTAWQRVQATNAVPSVFGRTGAITATSGDYTASEITNVVFGGLSSTDVQSALNELDTEKLAKTGGTMTGTLNLSGASGSVVSPASVTASAFFGDGANLSNLNASNVAAGTLSDSRLPGTMGAKTFSGAITANGGITLGSGQALALSGSGGTITAGSSVTASAFFGNGAGLTGISASAVAAANVTAGTFGSGVLLPVGNLTGGVVSSSVLPSTVVFTDATQTFTGQNAFQNAVTVSSTVFISGPVQTFGGNARGAGAVDLQVDRSNSSFVASGGHAVLGGGQDNASSGSLATVSGGYGNRAVANFAAIGGGADNYAGYSGAVSGGYRNYASGQYSSITGGYSNFAGGDFSFAAGYLSSSTAISAFTWADSEGKAVTNSVADRTWFKNRGGFLVTPSTGAADRGLFVSGSGKTGLGTTTPTALLHVAGDLRIASGTPTAGWVLTAVDSTGLATWVAAQGAGDVYKASTQTFTGQNTFANAITVSSTVFISGPVQSYGGNARGTGAVDLQVSRSNDSYVASGAYAALGGGADNTCFGEKAAVSGGYGNLAGGNYSSIAGGAFNYTGYFGAILGGTNNKASGAYSSAIGGSWNYAGGSYSFAAGNLSSSTASGAFTWSDSEGKEVKNDAADRTWFKNRGGFLVTPSTGAADRGLFVSRNGRTGLGTTTPTALLHVAGDLRIASGTPTAGWVLTAVDSTGLATWVAAQGAGDVYRASTQTFTGQNTFANAITVSSTVFISGPVQSYGGNARGLNAVDLQTSRADDSQVASGESSVIGGGAENSAHGIRAAVLGGYRNSAYGFHSIIGGGDLNTAGYVSSILGGFGNSAPGEYAVITGGIRNSAVGMLSFAAGYKSSSTANGAFTWSDSEGKEVTNSVADRAWFKNRGGFLVTPSTGAADRGLFVSGSGKTGLGTTTPTALLHVEGDLRIASGTPTAGWVLTAVDSTGLATWVAAQGAGDVYKASTQTFTGQNTFANAVTISSTVFISGPVQSAGGYGRGSYAVDLQTLRGSAANVASGAFSVIGGGTSNTAAGSIATVAGGQSNAAHGVLSTISGGFSNLAAGQYGMVPGGYQNAAGGPLSFAAGYMSSSTANGAFTWSDSEGVKVLNDVADRTWFKNRGGFLVSTSAVAASAGLFVSNSGKVGISTTSPTSALTVAGDLRIASGTPAAGWVLKAVDSTGLATWGAGGGGDVALASTQTFTGQNTFANAVAISSSAVISGQVRLSNGSPSAGYFLTAVDSSGLATWSAGGGGGGDVGLASTQTFSGQNTFRNAVTISSTVFISGPVQTYGGSARGSGAVDLQISRSNDSFVASGSYSVLSGGADNTSYGYMAAVSGGYRNYANGYYSAVAGGAYNYTGYFGSVLGGYVNTASGQYSCIVGGARNYSGGDYAFSAGYKSSSTVSGAFTWSDSEGKEVRNDVANRTWFKNRGGFLVTPSTGAADRGFFVSGYGLVGIGNTNPGYLLTMETAGGGYYSQAAHTWNNGSSKRWKTNVRPITGALDIVGRLQGVRFDWTKEHGGSPGVGFLAEDAGKVVPEVVDWSPAEPGFADGMSYGNLTAVQNEAIKELKGLVDAQQRQIDALKAEVERLKTR